MNLMLIREEEMEGEVAVVRGRRARHVVEVLGKGVGDGVRIGWLNGPRGEGEVLRVEGEEVWLRCRWREEGRERPQLDVILAAPRPKVMKRLWAQLAALGVGRIDVIRTWKVERSYVECHAMGREVYEPLLIEGLEQAQDTWLPVVEVHKRFRPFVEDVVPGRYGEHVKWLADVGERRWPGEEERGSGQRQVVAIGPEGGWTEEEREMLRGVGFERVSLGERSLRSDTATVLLVGALGVR